jgi:glutamate 5-kinase
MTTKIDAGKIATKAGTAMIIARGKRHESARRRRRRRPPYPLRTCPSRATARKTLDHAGSLAVAGALSSMPAR